MTFASDTSPKSIDREGLGGQEAVNQSVRKLVSPYSRSVGQSAIVNQTTRQYEHGGSSRKWTPSGREKGVRNILDDNGSCPANNKHWECKKYHRFQSLFASLFYVIGSHVTVGAPRERGMFGGV